MYVDDHQIIRLELLRELTSDRDCYLPLIDTEKRFNHANLALTPDGVDPALLAKLMTMHASHGL